LLESSLSAAKEFDFKRCYLETLPFMKVATALYERAGFIRIDGAMGATGHHGCDRWYIKEL
jgi:putative acetyltransferase